jgi:uncharacterized membrane protein YsdA (DUF1294 family)
MTLLQIYLLEICAAAFLLCAVDKLCARKNAWRVPEAALLLSAILGGAAGLFLGMLLFRHKTRHKRFIIGVPLLLLLQISMFYFLGK